MRRINFEDELLFWIASDVEARSRAGECLAVPIQMIITRMAIRSQDQQSELTQSTVLSLKAYDRATLLRTLNLLKSKDFIHFVDKDCTPRELEQPLETGSILTEWHGPEYVTATDAGLERAEMIARKFNL